MKVFSFVLVAVAVFFQLFSWLEFSSLRGDLQDSKKELREECLFEIARVSDGLEERLGTVERDMDDLNFLLKRAK